jgi:predicted TIM-barrel fold metal-dependent hydrolase
MILDCHVHAIACTSGHGSLSEKLLREWKVRFLRKRLGITAPYGEAMERQGETTLVDTINATPELDRAVVLAFDAVYRPDGSRDDDRTHLYVSNDCVAELAQKYPKVLFGASVHPYRPDAVAELERCVRLGAVLLKWLPIVQDFNPADERCLPFYEALAHHRLPLLCHTGGERLLPNLNLAVADPQLLVPALRKGVTVIAAHCGTRDRMLHTDYLPTFVRLAHEYENLYGDTAALNLPTRSYAYKTILEDKLVRGRLVHGSDWPVMSIATARIGLVKAAKLMLSESNWMRRDVLIKRELGFEDAYWHRAATLLRLPAPAAAPTT